jgi:hypothetical protein
MMQKNVICIVILLWALTLPYIASASQADDTMTMIERMISGEKSKPDLGELIVDAIERNPVDVSKELRAKLAQKNLTGSQLTVYVWALGLVKDQAAVSLIMDVYKQNESELVRGTCLRSLAQIGGKQSEVFLLSALDTTSGNEARFNILSLLGQMQCEAALPKTEEILLKDPSEYYWQSIFVFGKMGDKAVPFLLSKINDKNINVRAGVVNVLGQWLMAPESATALQNQFWIEKEIGIRGMILSSLERTIVDLAQMKAFFELVIAKESDEKLVKFAQETVSNIDKIKVESESFRKKKKVSEAVFQRQYALLFQTLGKKGNYEALAILSSEKDEAKLKALRERILQRDSDEAFYDYQKVNEIILKNRLARK